MIVGMHPYLVLNGNGKEAVEFYEKSLDAKVLGIQTFGDLAENPEYPMAEEVKGRVMNAHLKVGNTDLMLSDTFPGNPYQIGSQVTIALLINQEEKTREIFRNLQEEGQVLMELQQTFWSSLYGQVKDKFGVTWQVSNQAAYEG
ncbi:PhnB protein [Bacillus mesophilus]|uniref:VOC family protein n=1 Tax=Bacillus mesophilus TaxID=1808955 RepID=A0A6M0Q7G4_9BACI|nr:VOC family protein [Bacillus mesophilus]MBM7660337.1 PhnB protein [Bacillus mesophilus]NEY71048.1 VOC family protein [Bacillus mesophilus]